MVLIFELEMWVITPHMGRALSIFQNRVAQWLTERHTQWLWKRSWEYPLGLDDGVGNVGGGFGGDVGVHLEEG